MPPAQEEHYREARLPWKSPWCYSKAVEGSACFSGEVRDGCLATAESTLSWSRSWGGWEVRASKGGNIVTSFGSVH